mgnify:CR=1 FL=1|tara:strand:- start:276 stop:452 length:177 start_codon:yes stop_codon:yes gene_type:complete
MKDLSKKIRNGGVEKFNAKMLGKNTQGKGDFPRFSYQTSEKYKKNYDAIDWSNGAKSD